MQSYYFSYGTSFNPSLETLALTSGQQSLDPETSRQYEVGGKWEVLDITLVGRRVSVVLNGKQIICEQEIPGPTGGALDSKEGAGGPIMIQGDHGPVEYRNIVLTPAR